MEYSERTKRRKISAKVEEHLRLLENESMIDDLVAHESDKECPLDDLLEHTESEDSTDTFYDACDQNCFESNDLEEDFFSDSFYDFNLSSFDDLDSENWMPGDMPGCDSDSDLHGDECSDMEEDNNNDSLGLAEWAAEFNIPQTALSALLKILRRKGLDIPMDGRTLMSTDRSCSVANMSGGSYYQIQILSKRN